MTPPATLCGQDRQTRVEPCRHNLHERAGNGDEGVCMAIMRRLHERRYSRRQHHYLTSSHRSRMDGACGDHHTGDALRAHRYAAAVQQGRVFCYGSSPISSHHERPLLFVHPFASPTAWYHCAAIELPYILSPASLTGRPTFLHDPRGLTHVILLKRRRSSSRAPACACRCPAYAPSTRSSTTRIASANLVDNPMPTANLHKASFLYIEEETTAMYRSPRLQSQIPREHSQRISRRNQCWRACCGDRCAHHKG
jgi:hypothetical protein